MSNKAGKRQAWLTSLGVGLGVFVLCSLTWGKGLVGGKALVGAEIVLGGGLPYRDFWTMYAPGHFYVLAALLWMFGRHMLVTSVAAAVTCSITAGLLHRLLRELSGRGWFALGGVAVVAAAFFNTGYHLAFGSYPPALMLMTLSLNLLLAYLGQPRVLLLAATGLATGCVAVFKHDVGAYTAAAIGTGLLAQALLEDTGDIRARLSAAARAIWRFGLGVAGPVLIVGGAFALLAGRDMLQDLIVFPATDFRHSRGEYFPPLLPLHVYSPALGTFALNFAFYLNFLLPLLAVVALAIYGVGATVHRKAVDASLTVAFAVAFAQHWIAAHVQVNTHIISMSLYGVCAVAVVLPAVAGQSGYRRATWVRGLVLLLLFGWTSSLALSPAYRLYKRGAPLQATMELPKVSGTSVPAEKATELTELAEFVQSRVPPGQPIFVGNHRHDMIIVNDTTLYFVLDRPPATRYPELHPAIADTAAVQQEMIGDLREKRVALLVLKDIFSDETLDDLKKNMQQNVPEIGATDLDRYIRDNYTEERRFGRHAVWLLQDTAKETLDVGEPGVGQPSN